MPVRRLVLPGAIDPAIRALLTATPTGSDGVDLVVRVDEDAELRPGGYRISYRPDERVLDLAGADPGARHHAATVTAALVASAGGWHRLPGLELRDRPTVAYRGLMESFYGPVWSRDQRRFMVDLAARLRLNVYGYGPADDAQTGTDWRRPYEPDRLAELADLVEYARQRHIEVVYRISPSAPLAPERGIRFADDAELAMLFARLDQLDSIGIRAVTIAFDDIRGVLADPADRARFDTDPQPVAAAHAYLTNRVVRARPDWRVLACPTEYWGSEQSPYRSRLGELLDPAVQVWWTGPAIVSHEITAAQAKDSATAYRRSRLWLWDNFPVNDFDPYRLHLGPYAGRDPAAAGSLDAVVLNCGQVPEADALAVAAMAAYAWDPVGWDPEDARRQAATLLAGPAAPALLRVAELSRHSPLDPREHPDLSPAVWRYLTALDGGDPDARSAAATVLREQLMAAVAAVAPVRAAPELGWFTAGTAAWLDAIDAEATLGLAALAFLEHWLAGESGTSEAMYDSARQLRDLYRRLEPPQPRVLWNLVQPLAARARPASAVGGMPYHRVDEVAMLDLDPPG